MVEVRADIRDQATATARVTFIGTPLLYLKSVRGTN
jgi:hypothetical protein